MRKRAVVVIQLFAAALACAAQAVAQAQAPRADAAQQTAVDRIWESEERLSLATSSIEYPVTPSDIYTFTYHRSTGEPQSQSIQVASDYTLDLDVFGKLDAKGLTFPELKARVEALVNKSYSRSFPSLSIRSVGIFRVTLGGAIARPRYVNAWGLSRLSDIFEAADEPSASLRVIEVKRRDGSAKRYDLLMALRTGDESRNPVMKPGDTITLFASSGQISLSGAIRYKGSYELLPGEGLRDLVEIFGGGLANIADTSRVKIDRMTARGPSVQYVDFLKASDSQMSLEGCIAVTIPSRMESRPFVWFEGAVSSGAASGAQVAQGSAAGSAAPSAAPEAWAVGAAAQPRSTVAEISRISLQISDGEMLSDALRELKNFILPTADLSSASLFRQWSNVPIAVNLLPLLSETNSHSDIRLEPYDRIYIPTMESPLSVPHGPEFRERE
jgi:protein involved in polysaccharide export with SLBB domain